MKTFYDFIQIKKYSLFGVQKIPIKNTKFKKRYIHFYI